MKEKILALGAIYAEFHFSDVPFENELKKEQRVKGAEYRLAVGGGAALFSKASRVLGSEVSLMAKTGNEFMSQYIREMLTKSDIRPLIISSDYQTNVSLNLINLKGDIINAASGGANQSFKFSECEPVLTHELGKADILYLGGCYSLRSLIPHYKRIIDLAHQNNVKVALDHSVVSPDVTDEDREMMREAVEGVDYYFPSKDEFLATWDVENIENGLESVNRKLKGVIVVKDSNQGAHTVVDGKVITVPPFPVHEVTNPVGGGDSFNAGVLYGQFSGLDVTESIRFGNAVASLWLRKNEPPTLSDVQNLVS